MFDFEVIEDESELESERKQSSFPKASNYCDCGTRLDGGYCRNDDCDWDSSIETKLCTSCGNCVDPEHCVWSITCPVCGSPPKENCHEGTKLVGLHEERWNHAGSSWR